MIVGRCGARLLGLGLAAVVIAVTAALVSPTPAHAAGNLSVTSSVFCFTEEGRWGVEWTAYSPVQGSIASYSVTPSGSDVNGPGAGAIFGDHVGPATIEQILPAGETDASITVTAHVGGTETVTKTAHASGVCGQPRPSVSFASTCDHHVNVTLKNLAGATADAAFTVNADAPGMPVQVTVEPGEQEVVAVNLPPSYSDVVVERASIPGSVIYTWVLPAGCPPPTPPNPGGGAGGGSGGGGGGPDPGPGGTPTEVLSEEPVAGSGGGASSDGGTTKAGEVPSAPTTAPADPDNLSADRTSWWRPDQGGPGLWVTVALVAVLVLASGGTFVFRRRRGAVVPAPAAPAETDSIGDTTVS